MKTLSLTLLVIISIGISCKKDCNCPVTSNDNYAFLKDSLLLYLTFDGNLADSSGKGNNGVGYGSFSYGQNKYFDNNQALVLNGASRIEVPGTKFDGLGKFTIYTEFMPYTGSNMVMVSKTAFNAGLNQSFNFSANYSGNGLYFNMKKAGFCDNQTLAAYSNPVGASVTPVVNAWNYGAVSFDGTTVKIYMNGQKVGEGPNPGAVFCNNAPLQIGAWWNGDPLYFNGKIDEVRVYNRVLTDSEIKAVYTYRR